MQVYNIVVTRISIPAIIRQNNENPTKRSDKGEYGLEIRRKFAKESSHPCDCMASSHRQLRKMRFLSYARAKQSEGFV